MLTTLPQTPEIGALEEDEEPGGIGKFFKTVVKKKSFRAVKKPPLHKNGNNEANLPKQVKETQQYSQVKCYSNAFGRVQDFVWRRF